jgi:hypothetical protein
MKKLLLDDGEFDAVTVRLVWYIASDVWLGELAKF